MWSLGYKITLILSINKTRYAKKALSSPKISPMKQQTVIYTSIGELCIITDGDYVTDITFGCKGNTECCTKPGETLQQAACQLDEYFAGKRTLFDIPLQMNGSKFQRAVWHELQKIPYGTTVTYGEIARRIGQPNASRAVGMACNKNHLPILIPCHRVVGKNGHLTGFSDGIDIKCFLLKLEKATLFL